MSSRFLLSVFFGSVVAGLIWVLLVPEKKERSKKAVESADLRHRKSVEPCNFPQEWKGWRVWETREKMEVIESLEEMSFEELADLVKPELERLTKGVVWGFPQWAIFGRMSELEPRRTWKYLDSHFPGEVGPFSSFVDFRIEILNNWFSQDFEDCLQFLEVVERDAFPRITLLNLLEVGSPRGWMTFYHLNDGDLHVSRNERFVSSLRDGAECQEALETWRDEMPAALREKWVDEMENAERKSARERARKNLDPGSNPLIQYIVQRWREVDEEGFLDSNFAEWDR